METDMPMPTMKEIADIARDKKQAGIALIGLALVFGGIAFFFGRPGADADKAAPVAVATSTAPDAYASVHLVGKSAIVIDLTTGIPLYERNADAQLPLASLTKLLTTYAAVSALSPNSTVAITPSAIAQDGDYGLVAGEQFKFEDLARFALVGSSNDAADAIAEAAAAAHSTDMKSMLAAAAASANLSATYAMNGTGLDESATVSGGYGSARDVAKLAGALLAKAPDIAHATTLPSVTVDSLAGAVHSLPNTDIAVESYPDMLLSKTGYTDLAGGNLAIVFDAGVNHPVAVVVLGSTEESRFTDVSELVSATLAHFAGTVPDPAP